MPSITSCTSQEPFIKLDSAGQAPLLSYNLPEKTAFEVKGYINIKLNASCINPVYTTAPPNNFWDRVDGLPASQILEILNDDILGSSLSPGILNSRALTTLSLVEKFEKDTSQAALAVQGRGGNITLVGDNRSATATAVSGRAGASLPRAVQPLSYVAQTQHTIKDGEDALIAGVTIQTILNQIAKGRRPMITKNLYGKPLMTFLPKPVAPKPTLTLVLHYKMATFPGNYGAGRTVKTFTLLPGERTTISITNFKHDSTVSEQSKSVLDSFSESSAEDFQNTVENQLTSDRTKESSSTAGSEIGGGLNIGNGEVGVNVSGGVSNSSTTSTAIANHMSQLNSATDTHTSQASQNREVNVNTDVKTTSITERTDATIRELRNMNQSRTLNFIFRQLMQEFVTITYLNDVSIVFSNGYPEHKQVVKLTNINDLLGDVLLNGAGTSCAGYVDEIRKGIFRQLCNLFDYTGDQVSFMECVTETLNDCCGGSADPVINTYARKIKGLTQTAEGFTVPGIIFDVTKRIMRTDSVVVDALLGQGEALDCYNQQLQNIAVQKAQLENDQLTMALQIINSIDDAATKAANFKKVFGPCCEVAQIGGGCGCDETPSREESGSSSEVGTGV
ncbi:MAG: hypothetical protein ABIQ40_16760 [Bacteroidia bacterium]